MKLVKRISFISFLVFLFFVPFNWTWTNIFWFVSIVGVLMSKDLYRKISLRILFGEEKYFILFSSCYIIWCFVSLLWSEDLDHGLHLLGRYVSIIFFPLFICLARISGVIKRTELLIWAFVAGVLLSSCICLYLSYQNCWHATENGKVFNFDFWNRDITAYEAFSTGYSNFTYTYLSHFTHPAYYSIHFIFAIVFLFEKLFKTKSFIMKLFVDFGLLYCLVFVFFLQCRAELLCLVVVIVLSLVYYSIQRKYYKTLMVGLIVIVGFAIFIIPHTRLHGMIDGVKQSLTRTNNQDIEHGLIEKENVRIFLWKNAYEVIKRNPILGVGVGDVDSEMENENIKNKFPDTSLGSHNQYLYSWLAMGVLGFLLLLAMFATAFYYGIKNRYFPLLSFTITIMICIMFENMLTRVYGIMFIPWAMQVLLIMSGEKMLKDNRTN